MLKCSEESISLEFSQSSVQITQKYQTGDAKGFFDSFQKNNQAIEVRNLSDIYSFSIDNIVLHYEKEAVNQPFLLFRDDSYDFYSEESFDNTLFMDREYFSSNQRQLYKQLPQSMNNQTIIKNIQDQQAQQASRGVQNLLSKDLTYDSSIFMEQDFQSKNKQSSNNNKSSAKTKRTIKQSLGSTKNVTKNMGKLLMKFIWKNRHHLQNEMKVPDEKWELFIKQIRKSKGENNITRQYLLVRWKGDDENNKLFRTISHNFFRKRCVSTLYSSNIRGKQLHLQRIKKFDQAIINPKSLDSIN